MTALAFALVLAGCGHTTTVLTGDDKVYAVRIQGRELVLERSGEEHRFLLDREVPFEWGAKRWLLTDARLWKLLKQARLNAPEDNP